MDIRKYIIQKSKELNIDIIGFTDANPLTHLEDYLEYRKESNRMTEFEEQDLQKRIDPKLTMPNCKSIIVIGISYNVDYKVNEGYEVKGSLSRSSWGVDYHRVLKGKIEGLIDEIKKVKSFDYKYFVDTGPLIDRELAYKAGVGYYGKNCSIINPKYGSFIFLGYILNDIDLPYDSPITNDCGDCNLCLKACPTNALENPFELNPKKCISYLTQCKDNIDESLREKMGIKIYGCDTCQMVCPKNRDVLKSTHSEFVPNFSSIDIKQLMVMSNREFKEKYGTMAGSWRGKNVLKRNAIIALGNMKKFDHLDLVENALKENNPNLSKYAQWALEKIINSNDTKE